MPHTLENPVSPPGRTRRLSGPSLGRDGSRRVRLAAGALLCVISVALGACGGTSAQSGGAVTLRLGYLTNLTHAPALVGTSRGILQSALGRTVTLTTQSFNAGPAETEALLGGSLDAAYLGPNAAINAFVKSHGEALRIVSGATSGGASLVIRADSGITSAAGLRGRRLATPQLGNTQDVALRAWLLSNGLHTDVSGHGDVVISPTDNATTLQLFRQGKIDGAWVPEPWASRLVEEAHGTVLVDEATLWPQGRFPTTELAVSTRFLRAHPDVVRSLVLGNQTAVTYLTRHRAEAETAASDALAALTGSRLKPAVLDAAWSHLAFTLDPLLPQLKRVAADAVRVGTVGGSPDLRGIYDGSVLAAALRAAGLPPVDDAGLASS